MQKLSSHLILTKNNTMHNKFNVLLFFLTEAGNWQKQTISERERLQCSHCDGMIQDTRVKCLECANFNLCHVCDEQNIHEHHVMVRCERPRFFKFVSRTIKQIMSNYFYVQSVISYECIFKYVWIY